MRKSFVALLLLLGAAAALASTAFARVDGLGGDDVSAKLINAQMIQDMRSAVVRTGASAPGDTTYVGFVPGHVSASNYWGIFTGGFLPYNTAPIAYGYWGFDDDAIHNNIAEVHGDSLFGWWPYRNLYTFFGNLANDDQRPWEAIDIGNNANYVINQGAGHKRTFGVVGVWHRDNGSVGGGGVTWAPLGGSFSLWCGLRRHGDLAFSDPITGNPYNAQVLANSGIAGGVPGGGIGTNQKFPGYASQWDQMAYRDLNVQGKSSVTLRFKFRTNMSTGYGTQTNTRTGWFNKDPLDHHWATSAPNNYISSVTAGLAAPIDSFMVYVGAPVRDSLGVAASDGSQYFIGSDNVMHRVYDPQRRWFSEVLRVCEPTVPYHEVFTTYGDNAATTQVSLTAPVDASWGNKARVVFRNKTNRGFDDEGGSVPLSYSSGGAGAVVVDDIEVSYDGGATFATVSDFETAGQVNDSTTVDPLNAWKTTGKPPAIFHHVHNGHTLLYADLCGPIGGPGFGPSPFRTCNLTGNVISAGDHDNSEEAGGPLDNAEQERMDGIYSPTVNLCNSGAGANAMGINNAIATVTEDYYVEYDIYAGIMDPFTTGNLWRFAWSCYPGSQSDGTACWADWRFPGFIIFNPDKQCFQDQEPALALGLLKWNSGLAQNGAAYPDSLRMYLGKLQECYRFGVTTGCSPTDGAYWDNITMAFVDGIVPPITIDIWQLVNDTFTVNGGTNRSNVLPGSGAFDTTAALTKIGLNISQTTGNTSRYNVPGDTTTINADGNNFRIDLLFRINPGPGNYTTIGNKGTSLRLAPTAATPLNISAPASPANFWEQYLINNGAKGTAGGHPAGGVNGGKTWSELVWNSAMCDTAEINLYPIDARTLGGPVTGLWSTMYNELDPKFTILGLAKNRCFLKHATDGVSQANTTCDISLTDGWPITAGYVAENGLPLGQTYEFTKILVDGQFTPGTHVEYVFRREDASGSPCGPLGCLAPDTTLVFPQSSEGSTDAHRWQEFSVLPDMWKKGAYGGPGLACMLYVDLNDRRGDERVWVSVADSIGATAIGKYGAHNGWHSVGAGHSLNDPAGFVRNQNQQPGTTWDMFGVKASESLNTKSGTIGGWNSNHAASAVDGKWSYQGPSIGMLEAYYQIILVLSGDLNSGVLGPFSNLGNNDVKMLEDFMIGGTSTGNRGVYVGGDGFVESETGVHDALLTNFFKVSLRDPSYLVLTQNLDPCLDLVPQSPILPITSTGDIYGVRGGCLFTDDVLQPEAGGQDAAHYSPNGIATGPVISAVFHDVNGAVSEYWKSVVEGFDIRNARSRGCDASVGRLTYYFNAISKVFVPICTNLLGSGTTAVDGPNTGNGQAVVDFMNLRNNPLISGHATVDLGISKADRVEVKVFDVSGRLVRTLADRQFQPGRYQITWDGVDNAGRQVARGVYFTQVKYVNSRFTDAKKLTILK